MSSAVSLHHATGARPASTVTAGAAASAGRVAIVGLGYVGLPTALALATAGRSVVGFDISEGRLADIKAGRADLSPADQARLTHQLVSEDFLLTTESSELALASAVIVCVPTPVDGHFVPDLRALSAACETVVAAAVPGQVLILTSTSYVGTTKDLLVDRLEKRGLRVGIDVFVAFSPERIDPGNDSHRPEQTPRVIGGVTAECTRRAVAVLSASVAVMHVVSSPEAAELTKLLENTFRAVNIAFANEFSTVARELNIDAMEVIQAAATKPYGFMPFYPGAGVGGHCIPCDPHYLLWQLKARRVASPVTEAAMASIAGRPRVVVTRIQQLLSEQGRAVSGSKVLIVGVTYKPGVADLRSSSSLEIIDELETAGAQVSYTDAYVEQLRTRTGELRSETAPAGGLWDLVVVHTVHPGVDHNWLATAPIVLDTTYRLPAAPNRHVL